MLIASEETYPHTHNTHTISPARGESSGCHGVCNHAARPRCRRVVVLAPARDYGRTVKGRAIQLMYSIKYAFTYATFSSSCTLLWVNLNLAQQKRDSETPTIPGATIPKIKHHQTRLPAARLLLNQMANTNAEKSPHCLLLFMLGIRLPALAHSNTHTHRHAHRRASQCHTYNLAL